MVRVFCVIPILVFQINAKNILPISDLGLPAVPVAGRKRGGYRIIYLWKANETKIYILLAYFKGEKVGISKKEIEALLKKFHEELV